MCLITGNKVKKTQAKVLRKTKVQSQQNNYNDVFWNSEK
jgi:hypothetical protein